MSFHLHSLKDVENQLNDIAIEAGSQVDRLVNCVAQNGQLQKQIKESLENQVAQSIMTAIISVDQDGSFTLDQREVMKLELKLENLPAVHFDHKNFENFLKASNQKEDLSLTDLGECNHSICTRSFFSFLLSDCLSPSTSIFPLFFRSQFGQEPQGRHDT